MTPVVETYPLKLPGQKKIQATMVRFPDGRVVQFGTKVPDTEAIASAKKLVKLFPHMYPPGVFGALPLVRNVAEKEYVEQGVFEDRPTWRERRGRMKSRKKNVGGTEVDETAGDELTLYIQNDSDLYHRQTLPIYKNLVTKIAQKRYSPSLARKLFGYLVESGAKKYVKEFDPSVQWHVMFDLPTRAYVADRLADDFEAEAKLGNYDHLLPKKYQRKHNPSAVDPKRYAKLLNPF